MHLQLLELLQNSSFVKKLLREAKKKEKFFFFFFFFSLIFLRGGGHSNGKRGYQARPWTHKKHPNHVFFRYENRP